MSTVASPAFSAREAKHRTTVDYTSLNLIYGEDGIYSTLDDMFRWVRAIDEIKPIHPTTWQRAFTAARLNNGSLTDYEFGWIVARLARWRVPRLQNTHRALSEGTFQRRRALKLQGTRRHFDGQRHCRHPFRG
jgi:hypothetical protein